MERAFDAFISRVSAVVGPSDVQIPRESNVIQAAVILLLRRSDDGGEIIFIKRAHRKGDPWSGHLAFPGGHAEKSDASLLDAALREAAEEVGIDVRDGGRVLGSLPTFAPLSRRLPPLAVTPFVARAPDGAVARPQESEVDDCFWMSVAALREGGTSTSVRMVIDGQAREWPAYPSPRGPIWGITERILTRFLRLTS